LISKGVTGLSNLIGGAGSTGNSYGTASNNAVQDISGFLPSSNLQVTNTNYGNPLTSNVIVDNAQAYDAAGIPIGNNNWGEG